VINPSEMLPARASLATLLFDALSVEARQAIHCPVMRP
jgi:hypothetical protein